MAEKTELAARARRARIELEVSSHPVISELVEKHGAKIREIKIY